MYDDWDLFDSIQLLSKKNLISHIKSLELSFLDEHLK